MSDDSWRGRVGPLDSAEVEQFLTEPIFARIATLDAEGWPHVVPVWHEWSEGRFWVIGRKKSGWALNLEADPRCAVTVDEDGGQRKVIAQCRAELVEQPNVGGRWVAIAERMSVRYLGEHGPDYLVPTLEHPRWLYALEPVKVWTWQGNDWAPRYKTD
jgi:general stress protein 26